MFAHDSGIGRTALVTTCTWMPRFVRIGSSVVELAKPHERFAADDRQMQWLQPVDDVDHAVDQFLALVVGKLSQNDVAAEVGVAIGVAARAPQRTLARDLNRQVRPVAREDAPPSLEDGTGFHF